MHFRSENRHFRSENRHFRSKILGSVNWDREVCVLSHKAFERRRRRREKNFYVEMIILSVLETYLWLNFVRKKFEVFNTLEAKIGPSWDNNIFGILNTNLRVREANFEISSQNRHFWMFHFFDFLKIFLNFQTPLKDKVFGGYFGQFFLKWLILPLHFFKVANFSGGMPPYPPGFLPLC